MKHPVGLFSLIVALGLTTACNPVDRSDEQPFAPTVETLGATVEGDHALLAARVTASPNSDLTACGFAYGNDTLRAKTTAEAPNADFTALTDSLGAGRYYAVAFAQNGVGTSYGDTIHFVIP